MLTQKLIEALSISSGRTVQEVCAEADTFTWPADSKVECEEALTRYLCARIIASAALRRVAAP